MALGVRAHQQSVRPALSGSDRIPAAEHRRVRRRQGQVLSARLSALVMVVASALVGGAATAQAAAPQRVMSLNLCTDQLLLQLLPPERIASVTYLSRERSNAYRVAEAQRVPMNHGLAEE